jgi:hypothetical protein
MTNELIRKVKVLNGAMWHGQVDASTLGQWLRNFGEPDEREHALYLLSHFMYFDQALMRAMLKSMYRDHIKYPAVATIRRINNDTTDLAIINDCYAQQLRGTRFLGIGNPSESGTHLLYYFRQASDLPKDYFVNFHELFDYTSDPIHVRSDIVRVVIIDDLAGSGDQAIQYSGQPLAEIQRRSPTPVRVEYHVLFATKKALERIRQNTNFDDVRAVYEIDDSFKCVAASSRYFPASGFSLQTAHQLASKYGSRLLPDHPLGYRDGQLLLGFCHNIPDNTLPIVWQSGSIASPWFPIFRRYDKKY